MSTRRETGPAGREADRSRPRQGSDCAPPGCCSTPSSRPGPWRRAALSRLAVRAATRVRAVPSSAGACAPSRFATSCGSLDFDSGRGGVLCWPRATPRSARAPRLRRAFSFVSMSSPTTRRGTTPITSAPPSFERFHEIMAGAGVPYLVAVLPRVSREPLSPTATGSRPLERRRGGDASPPGLRAGASFGLHGRDHRTRFGLSARPFRAVRADGRRDRASCSTTRLAELARHGIRPDVFVPPYNRFDARQLEALARRFEVVCGGPESIGLMGFQRAPAVARGDRVPALLCARVRDAPPRCSAAWNAWLEREGGLWVPVVLHWGWEARRRLQRSATPGRPHRALCRPLGGLPRRHRAQPHADGAGRAGACRASRASSGERSRSTDDAPRRSTGCASASPAWRSSTTG